MARALDNQRKLCRGFLETRSSWMMASIVLMVATGVGLAMLPKTGPPEIVVLHKVPTDLKTATSVVDIAERGERESEDAPWPITVRIVDTEFGRMACYESEWTKDADDAWQVEFDRTPQECDSKHTT